MGSQPLLAFVILVLTGICQTTRAAVPLVYAGSCSDSSYLADGAGTLNGWGANGGNLGVGGYYDQLSPVAIPYPSGVHGWKIVSAAGGFYGDWTFAIGDDSQLYGAGHIYPTYPQYLSLIQPPAGVGGWAGVSASDQGWLAVATNGPIYGNVSGSVWWPLPPAGATRWTQVAVRSYFSPNELDLFALDDRGRLYGVYSGTAWFPSPGFTQVPLPPGATAWTNVCAGGISTLAQANDGNLYGWGHNDNGQLGLGYRFSFTNAPQKIALPSGKTGWGAISAGQYHMLATTTDGQLYAWGYNGSGQLGFGDQSSRYLPFAVPNMTNVTAIAAGYGHSVAVANCQVLAWGANSHGQLGAGFTSTFYPLPLGPQFNYDICSTNPPALPVVSVTAPDPAASEGTWLSTLGTPVTNTGRFEVSRTLATGSSLQVNFSVGGTASNGVDYLALPSSVTIPANSNSISILIVPTGSTLALDPSTVMINVLSNSAYQFGNSASATITLIQYEAPPPIPVPTLTLQLFVGTNLTGHAFAIQSSTNLTDWSVLGTGTNVWGVVSVTETNRLSFRQRFFRAMPLP